MRVSVPNTLRGSLRLRVASPSASSWIRNSTTAPSSSTPSTRCFAEPSVYSAPHASLRRLASSTARQRPSEPFPLSTAGSAVNPPTHETRRIEPLSRTDIKLRPYQVDCVRAVLDELERGEFSRVGVSAPTGSGKTAIFTSLISHLPALVHPVSGEVATQVLIIVNSIQLASQTAGAVKRAYPHLIVEVEQGRSLATGHADVTVCTFQTLARSSFSRLEKFLPERFKAVIVDEAHHAAAPSYLEILARFDSHVMHALGAVGTDTRRLTANEIAPAAPLDGETARFESAEELEEADDFFSSSDVDSPALEEPDPVSESSLPTPSPLLANLDSLGRMRVPLLAFTATWGRADGLALGKVFEKIVWHGEWLSMIKGNWLSQLEFTTVHLGSTVDMAKIDVSSSSGEFNIASLARAIDKREVNQLAVNAWLENARDRRSTLVFAVSVAHVISLANEFRERGIDARFVYEGTKQKDREELYRAFKAGEYPVLVNCGILTEGADFPAIDCVVLARPTRSQNLFLQMIGRGLRLSSDTGKENCLVLDLIGNSTDLGIACTPTLFGIDPATVIQGQSPQQLEHVASRQAASKANGAPAAHQSAFLHRHSVSYKHYTAFDLVSQHDASGQEEHVPISRLSRLAWVGCGDAWVLELMGRGYVKIMRDGEEFHSLLYLRLPAWLFGGSSKGPRYSTPTPLAAHESLALLLRATDAAVLHHAQLAELASSLTRYSPWRRKPATEAQRNYILRKLLNTDEHAAGVRDIEGVWVGQPWKARVSMDESITTGMASDIIARLVHGGLGFWKKQRSALVREEKRAVRDQEKLEKRLEKARVARTKRAK